MVDSRSEIARECCGHHANAAACSRPLHILARVRSATQEEELIPWPLGMAEVVLDMRCRGAQERSLERISA